ncbi:MAG: shikimate kinase, partial [Acidobacteriaceae bacterium]
QSIAEIFAARGEASFRQLEHRALAVVLARPQVVLALGGGAVETEATRQLLSGDPETLLIYLEAPLDVLIARCEQQEIADANAARRPVLERRAELAARFHHRRPLYELAHWTIPTAGLDTVQIVQTILSRWNQQVCGFPDSTPDPPPNPTRHPTR